MVPVKIGGKVVRVLAMTFHAKAAEPIAENAEGVVIATKRDWCGAWWQDD